MLSIFFNLIWGHAAGIYVGAMIGGLMVDGKHNYKREDVKKDKLKEGYLQFLDNEKYPNIEKVANDSKKARDEVIAKIGQAQTITELVAAHKELAALPQKWITDDALIFFKRDSKSDINDADDATSAQTKLIGQLEKRVGKIDGDKDTLYQNSTENWKSAFDKIRTDYIKNLQTADDVSKLSGADFLSLMYDGDGTKYTGLKNSSVAASYATTVKNFDDAVAAYKAATTPADTDPVTVSLKRAGKALVDAWAFVQIKDDVKAILANEALQDANGILAPILSQLKAYGIDKNKILTGDDHNPPGAQVKPLTSPLLSDDPAGEGEKWETLEGEETTKREFKLTYGMAAGYQKEMNKHMLVGGEAFMKKDVMTIKYQLQVKNRSQAFGSLSSKPGWTYGFTVVAGKHFNPAFSVFGRGSFEFTKWKFSYKNDTDSPKMTMPNQELGNWIKQPAVGVGARYHISDGFFLEACYDFLPSIKTTVRDFNELGADQRRRGYVYTTSQHRVMFKIVKFFNPM